jgi:hypothetical protein
MKVVLTLLVRDEADVLEDFLAFHLAAGVDLVIATDHRSEDGTTEILERYAREGRVHLIREEAERIRQSDWMTRMARLAAEEHGADWVINSDADEFWWPREGSITEVLAAVPAEFGVVRAVSRVFVPRSGEGWFAERLTARLALPAPINDPATPFRHVAKAAHRGSPRAVVLQGNHTVAGAGPELRGWCGLELLHFPLRSAAQVAGKHRRTIEAWEENLRGDLARARSDSVYDRVVVDDEAVRRGIADGSLVVDTRLRDALRTLRDGRVPAFARATPAADASRAVDAVVLVEADGVRLQRRVDELAARMPARRRYGFARR